MNFAPPKGVSTRIDRGFKTQNKKKSTASPPSKNIIFAFPRRVSTGIKLHPKTVRQPPPLRVGGIGRQASSIDSINTRPVAEGYRPTVVDPAGATSTTVMER